MFMYWKRIKQVNTLWTTFDWTLTRLISICNYQHNGAMFNKHFLEILPTTTNAWIILKVQCKKRWRLIPPNRVRYIRRAQRKEHFFLYYVWLCRHSAFFFSKGGGYLSKCYTMHTIKRLNINLRDIFGRKKFGRGNGLFSQWTKN